MPSVLIVDDDEMDRRILQNLLCGSGYEVLGTARTGEEGISLFKQMCPDLVTLDLMLPGLNGIEVLQRIMYLNPQANVLMCTASDSDPIVELSRKCGARGYICKPYQAAALLRTVKRVIGDPSVMSSMNTGGR